MRRTLTWAALAAVLAVPVLAAASSPLLAYREPFYIVAGLAGVIGMALLVVQPLLAGGALPGLSALASRRAHRLVGAGLVLAVVVHVAALWITSPPDVIDALLLSSPAPFSLWGVVAMWSVLASAILAALRRPLRRHLRGWRLAHVGLGCVIAAGTVAHALLIDGTMEVLSKIALCLAVVAATAWVAAGRIRPRRRTRSSGRSLS